MTVLLLAADAMKPTGRIVGGWGYIWAAYLVTLVGLAIYVTSLVLRHSASKNSKDVPP